MRIALFGYNNIAQKHLQGIRHCRNQLVAVSGRNVERAQAMTAAFGNPPVYADYRELLIKERPELVVVATPNFTHGEMTIAALENGANVLCEKPLGINAEEVSQMYQAAEDAGRMLFAGMSSRYALHSQWIKKRLAKSAQPHQFQSGEALYLRAKHIPGATGFLTKKQAGGGALLDLGTHLLDLALWFWGKEPITAVEGRTKLDLAELQEEKRIANDYGERLDLSNMDVEYEAEGRIHFASGGVLEFRVSWASEDSKALSGPSVDEWAPFISLRGTKSNISWKLKQSQIIRNSESELYTAVEDVQERYTRQIEHVLQAMRGEAHPLIHKEEITRLHRIIDALYLSAARNGEQVSL